MTDANDLAMGPSGVADAPIAERAGLKVLIFFDTDRTIANFLMTGAFRDLCERHRVTFVTPPRSKRFSLDPVELFEPDTMLALPTVEARVALWSRMAMIDQLAWRPGEHWRKMRRMRRMAMGRRERLMMSAAALPGASVIARAAIRRQLARVAYTDLDKLLEEQKPDVVIYPTAFNGPFANDLAISSKLYGIPSVFLMNSWDNPSTKNLLSEMPAWIGVWGEQTASHAVRFMGADRNRVAILGAPQLEALTEAPATDSRSAKIALGLDPNRPVLMFGESSVYENTMERLLGLEVWCDRQIDPKPQILFRPYPFGMAGRADEIHSRAWRNVLIQKVSPYQRTQSADALKAVAGDRILALYACDAVISALSTILIEAMLLGKHLLCVIPSEPDSIFSPRNAPLAHFREILVHPDVVVVSDRDSIEPALDQLVMSLTRADACLRLKAVAEDIVAPLPDCYSHRLANFVETICRRDPIALTPLDRMATKRDASFS